MAKMLLTDITMRGLARETARREVPDSKVPGLMVQTEKSGRPTFHVRKMIKGNRRMKQVGAYPDTSLADARTIAAAYLEAWAAGHDAPDVIASASPAEPPPIDRGMTVRDAIMAWQTVCDAPGNPKRWSMRHAMGVSRSMRVDVFPKLGDRYLGETTRADWTALVMAKQATAPAMASLLYRHISRFLNYADAAGWRAPLLARAGLSVIAPTPEPRGRTLTDAELVAVWHACDSISVRQRALVRLLILTGARLNEVAGITPAEIDLAAKRWSLPGKRSKNGKGYVMPLCPLAIAELRAVGADMGRFNSFSKLKAKLDAKAGVTGWRFHDLRRTLRSGLSAMHVLDVHAEAAINHQGSRTGLVGVYDQHDYAPEVIDALTKWQDRVASLVGANVIKLTPKRRKGGM